MEFVSNKFQSTLPIQGETYGRFSMSKLVIHFNPLSLYRERLGLFKDIRLAWIFQSTLPIQGETKRMGSISLIFAFQSTLPIQGETVIILSNSIFIIFQSTLPIQGETASWHTNLAKSYISIHSPYTGRDKFCPGCGAPVEHFNPLSLYRERLFQLCSNRRRIYFNPLSLYRERLLLSNSLCVLCFISIHSPYTGRDCLSRLF